MDFNSLSKLSSLLSRAFSEDILRLLLIYNDISASEAASRLDQHIKTAQDFLEGLASLGILEKREVYEGKRPYFRYKLRQKTIQINFDLNGLYNFNDVDKFLSKKIRERKNSGARFSTSSGQQIINNVAIWTGEGRDNRERKISFTSLQGKFIFHLPFPTAEYKTISEIMEAAGIDNSGAPEVLDIVNLLNELGIIEYEESN